ncbi:hypothetical protein D3C72_519970 [compost metagenome]
MDSSTPESPDRTVLTEPLRDKIVSHAKAGNLLALIDDRFDQGSYEDFKRVCAACAGLHNDGEINLLGSLSEESITDQAPHQFFTLQQFYVEAIPTLDVPLVEMLNLVDTLVRRGGEDLAANQPNGALLLWLKHDLNRAESLLKLAEEGAEIAVKHITFALQALGDVDRAQALTRNNTGRARLSGLTALARLKHTPAQADFTRTLVQDLIVGSSDDDICSHAVAALFGACASATAEVFDVAATLDAMGAVGPHTQHQAAHALWGHAVQVSPATRERLFDLLECIQPQHKGILRTFDQALSAVFDVAPNEAIAAGKRFLIHPNNSHELTELPSFGTALIGSPDFGLIFLGWLHSGEHEICDGLHDLLQKRDRGSKPIDLPCASSYEDNGATFICCKAVGYFFTQPVVAASVLVAFLRQPDREVASHLEDLLVEPLLSNYGGELREYLGTIQPEDPAYARVASALGRSDAYLEELSAIGRIAELRPSETERQIERVRHADEMRRSMKEARKDSIFFDLVSRSVVLHGRRTTSYRRLGDEPLQRFDLDLASHGVSFEIPRTEAADPLGLNFMILTFRNLRREA